ncbi:hypothetical protein AVEN_9613-1 [Araneus ventricosus]|uniref:Uncharacterized protein n=1 Tax=Araneus ventricosus TaxID=182803 RepID=A0A4Y2TR72_ARAVE|nr:hypothetical protein AVEN_9613-1 [Araneus ventricosus]
MHTHISILFCRSKSTSPFHPSQTPAISFQTCHRKLSKYYDADCSNKDLSPFADYTHETVDPSGTTFWHLCQNWVKCPDGKIWKPQPSYLYLSLNTQDTVSKCLDSWLRKKLVTGAFQLFLHTS